MSTQISEKAAKAVDINFDRYAGYSINGKEILPLTGGDDSVLSHIYTGQAINVPSDGIITYGFYTGNHAVGLNNNPQYGEGPGYAPFSEEQKAAAISAIQLWDDLIPQSFVNVGDVGTKGWAHNDATILFANTTTGPAQAWAYYPGGDHEGTRVSSDVWTADPTVNSSNGEFGFRQYGRTTLVHEIGHTLGLSHPGDYNFGADNDGDGQPDPITYGANAEYFQDSQEYTVMSYFGAWNTGGAPIDWRYSGGIFYDNSPQGPMLHDIYAIQTAYGADPTTRSGDTTYGFHSNAGNALYDFNQNPLPYYALYDAGGSNDTIDLSGFTASQYLNLNPGEFSSIGDVLMSKEDLGAAFHNGYLAGYGVDLYTHGYTDSDLGDIALGVLADTEAANAGAIEQDTGVAGIGTVNYENFAIAYDAGIPTIIENAIGSQGNDLIVGNSADNRIDGQSGNDALEGGAGNDTFVFHDDKSTDSILDFQTGHDKIDLSAIVGVTAADVSYNATTHQVQIDTDHNGVADLFINSVNIVNSADYLFHG